MCSTLFPPASGSHRPQIPPVVPEIGGREGWEGPSSDFPKLMGTAQTKAHLGREHPPQVRSVGGAGGFIHKPRDAPGRGGVTQEEEG